MENINKLFTNRYFSKKIFFIFLFFLLIILPITIHAFIFFPTKIDTLQERKDIQIVLNTVMVPSPNLKVDGVLGKKSIQAIQAFQESRGLITDGKVGAITRSALEKSQTQELNSVNYTSYANVNNLVTKAECSSGALYSTITGRPCTTTSLAINNIRSGGGGGGSGGSTIADTTNPIITSFTIPSSSLSLTVPITTFTATDNTSVTGYILSESSATPSVSSGSWVSVPPSSYTFTTEGVKNLYAWARDSALNISLISEAMIVINSTGDVFFVSSSLGNDNNDGVTISTPLASLAKVSNLLLAGTINAGDLVVFRSGDIFVGTLNTNGVDGTSGNPVTFSSYGSGEKPIFSGLVTLTNSWVDQGSNIWRYDVSSLPSSHIRYLLSNGVNQKMAQSVVRYTNSATTSSFVDTDLGGADDDYNGAEVLMRTASYIWDIRNVTDYIASSGTVNFSPNSAYALGSVGGSSGGYFFQNSLKILQQNSTQNEWVHQGSYIYYYSTSNPYDLIGDIQVSSIDTLVNIEDSHYIHVDGINFKYANQFAIYGGNSSYKEIKNCEFERVNVGFFENNKSSSNSIIDNNIFTDIGSIAIYQYHPVNLTVTNNDITNVGLEIGRMYYYVSEGASIWYSGIVAYFVDGGLFEYNNLFNIGYIGFHLSIPTNHVLIRHNYMENPCLVLVDGGAYYSYSEAQTVSSNIDQLTVRNNIAVFDDYSNLDYLIGYEGSSYGSWSWIVNGFYKDGFLRATNWIDNFSFGFANSFFSNPSMYSLWDGNVGINKYYSGNEPNRAFSLGDINLVLWVNNIFTNNTLISNYFGSARVGLVYENQLSSAGGNSFDYNKMLEPFDVSAQKKRFYSLGSATYLSIDEWKAKDAVGPHETSNLFTYSMSGLSDPSLFIWYATNPTKSTVSVSFPSGYRYYTVDGDIVTSDTLGVYEGKVYYRTINEGMPQATGVAISGGSSFGDIQTGSYTYSHENGNTESGSTYQWYRSYDGTIEARVAISGATSTSYTTTITDQGQYIILGITPKSAAGSGLLLTGIERFSSSKLIN